ETFQKDSAQLLFGLRHGKAANGNRLFQGSVSEARFYDHALAPAEIENLAAGFVSGPSDSEIRKALSLEEIEELDRLLDLADQQTERLGRFGVVPPPSSVWEQIAHSVFNLKEFIYLH
ncbi:MAG: hypothetical protein AAF236_10345, partial [Verrucomicrobiota bacterium]